VGATKRWRERWCSVVDRGVNLVDTANIYGYGESEEIIAEALHPYPDDLLITTKAGFKAGKIVPGERSLPPLGTPNTSATA
jgi:pyridoxine 4-dehydrogenase